MSNRSTVNLEYQGAYLFPSSSTDGRGKLLTESNIRDITEKFQTRNFKELRTDFVLGKESGFTISGGVAVINGYKIYVPDGITVDIPDTLESNKTYDVSLNIAIQNSTDGWIADTYNQGNGVMYIEYTESSQTGTKTVQDLIDLQSGDDKYKVAINRYNKINANNIISTRCFSDNYYDETIPEVSDNSSRFSSSLWVINRDNGLFILNSDLYDMKDLDFNALYSGGRNPTLKLTLGSIYINEQRTLESVKTYDCTKRIDVDDIFVGDSTFAEYLNSFGDFVKTYGGNVITSLRDTDESYSDDNGTGKMLKIPYVSTIDTLFYKYNAVISAIDTEYDSSITYYTKSGGIYTEADMSSYTDGDIINIEVYYYAYKYDNKYMYAPYTYIGESYKEKLFAEYSNESTYAVGDIVSRVIAEDNVYEFYECKTAIDTAEEFTPAKWIKIDKPPLDEENVDDLQSIIECSFNTIPTKYYGYDLGETKPSGSQILSITSLRNCYTKYSYNILQRLYTDGDLVDKQCGLNEYYIGLLEPSDYLTVNSDDKNKFPPFGLYTYGENSASALIKTEYDTTGSTPHNLLELKTSVNSVIRLTANVTYQTTTDPNISEYDGYKRPYYDIGDKVIQNGVVWICTGNINVYSDTTEYSEGFVVSYNDNNTIKYYEYINSEPSTGTPLTNTDYWKDITDSTDPESFIPWNTSLWSIVYINNGNLFEVKDGSAFYNIYENCKVKSYAGFINNSGKSMLEFYNKSGDTELSSRIYLEDTKDTYGGGDGTPVIGFSDNVKVTGYVRANRVYNAVYNDYAEWYNSNNAVKVHEGDVIYYNPETDSYENHYKSPSTVIGVCSEKYGVIVGGKDLDNMEENRKDFIPVSLCGRSKIKLDKSHKFMCGDFIYADGGSIGVADGIYKIGKFLKYIDEDYGIIQVFLS